MLYVWSEMHTLKVYFYIKMASHVPSAKAGGSGSVIRHSRKWDLKPSFPTGDLIVSTQGFGFGLGLWAQIAVAGQQLPLVDVELGLILSPKGAG